jgi:ABC-type spermidine/putrescine transport system permease subunit I
LAGLIPKTFALQFAFSSSGPIGHSWLGNWIQLYSFSGLIVTTTLLLLPLGILIMTIARNEIDRNMVLAALELGANRWQSFRKVILPNLRVGLALTFSLVFIQVIADVTVVDLLGGGRAYTMSYLAIDSFKINDWGMASAASMLTLMLCLPVIYVISRLATVNR